MSDSPGAFAPDAELRFVADAMLGRLARYLRFLGFDTAYRAHVGDAELARQAIDEGRILLTRDHRMVAERKVTPAILLESDRPLDQLRELAARVGIARRSGRPARCTLCNEPLRDVPRESLGSRLSPGILDRHDRFWSCPSCRRIYWEGTHVDRLRANIEVALGDRRG